MFLVFARKLYQRSFNYGDKNRVPLHSANTCGWFLEHPNFIQWQQSTESSAIWVTADAGCGKSVLANFLIGQLLSDNHTVIHFFFQHFRYDKNALLCSLLHQLLKLFIPSSDAKSSTLLHMLCDELEYKGEQIMHEDEILWKVICNATTRSRDTSSKLFCIIDGLDECPEPSRSQFIELMVSTFSTSGTSRQPHQPPNFLITSRPYPVIEERFRPLSYIRLRLENETSAISKDIETMITDKIHNLNPTRFPSRLQEYLRAEISRKAGRTFLWVKLIFEALQESDSTTKDEVRKLLDTNPNELNTFYEFSLSGSKDQMKTRRLLYILIAAARPLSLDEVNVALQIRETCVYFEDIDLEPDIEGAIKRLCGSVLRIINSTVDFMHQTAKEFLTASRPASEKSQNLTWRGSFSVSQSHCVLGSICLWYMALEDWDEKCVQCTGEKSADKIKPCEWAIRVGRLPINPGHSNHSEGGHPVESASLTNLEFDKIQAEAEAAFCFYNYAGRNWPRHTEKVLSWVQRPKMAKIESHPDFRQLQASLTSLRELGMGRIRQSICALKDPFLFLYEKGFDSVVSWFLNGPRIRDYPDCQIVDTCVAGMNKPIWPLIQYAITMIETSEQCTTDDKNKMFSRIADKAVAESLISIVEQVQKKAEITFDRQTINHGLRMAVRKQSGDLMAKLIDWGATDDEAHSLLASFKYSSCIQQIRLLLFRIQDYRRAPESFSCIYPKIFAEYRFDQEDPGAEQTEIFERFLCCVLDMPLDNYIYALLEAIRWRHPSVGFLIRSRVDLVCATKDDDPESNECPEPQRGHYTCLLHEVFSVACRYGSPVTSLLFEYFYPAIDVNQADVFGITPLVAAILADDYSLCEWLLRKKANARVCLPNKRKKRNCPPCEWTERLGLNEVVVWERARRNNLDLPPRIIPPRAWEWNDYYPIVPMVWDRYGKENFIGCPLVEALRRQNLPIFELLRDYGGDTWHDHETGTSVLEAAASHSESFFDEVVDRIRTKEVDSFDINRPETHSRRTLLHIAAKSGFWSSVTKLISEGSTVNIADASRCTPLHEIASFPPTTGRVETFKKLVEDHNADVSMTNIDGETPLGLLEKSISKLDLLSPDQGLTLVFFEKLRNEPSYLPSVRRSMTMALEDSQGNVNVPLAASSSGADSDPKNSSDELDPGSGLGSNVDPEAMSDIHSNDDERSDADDRIDFSQPVPRNTSPSQPHEERGLFPWLFLMGMILWSFMLLFIRI